MKHPKTHGIIYLINNTVNNKKYVGQTTQPLEKRWLGHACSSSKCTYLSSAIKKYGKDSFTYKKIDTAGTQEELNEKEVFWIESLNTLAPRGYNLQSGSKYSKKENTKATSEAPRLRDSWKGLVYVDESKPVRNRKYTREFKIAVTETILEHNNYKTTSYEWGVGIPTLKAWGVLATAKIDTQTKQKHNDTGNLRRTIAKDIVDMLHIDNLETLHQKLKHLITTLL